MTDDNPAHLQCLCEQFRCDDNQATVMQLACEEELEEQYTNENRSVLSIDDDSQSFCVDAVCVIVIILVIIRSRISLCNLAKLQSRRSICGFRIYSRCLIDRNTRDSASISSDTIEREWNNGRDCEHRYGIGAID